MSQSIAYPWEQPAPLEYAQPTVPPFVEPLKRSLVQPALLLVPTFISVIAKFSGAPIFTDLAWIILAVLCFVFLIQELVHFTERFGIGGIVLYGGVLIWFCYDYFTHWIGVWNPRWTAAFRPEIVATSSMWHMLFVTCMSLGINIRLGQWLPRLMLKLPEPRNLGTYFWIVIATQVVGLFPYAVANAEPFHLAIWHQIVAGRSGMAGVGWLVGRTANVNYNFGAYLAQVLQVGEAGALLAGFYAIFLSKSWFQTILCSMIFFLWLALGFGTGARGEVAFMIVPILGFLFIRFHVEAADVFKKWSKKAYIILVVMAFGAMVLIQIQIRFRNEGFISTDLSSVNYSRLEGNSMFSEGLMGFEHIPEPHDYFYNSIPGEAIIMPIPSSIFWFCVAPLPRALFTFKPIDPVWAWYNEVCTGKSATGATGGTTVSEGLVGNWYFRFGIAGVIEGGLLIGWLMGVSERALLNNRGRPMAVLFSLGVATWLFRCYRDFSFNELWALLVGLFGISILILMLRPFTGAPQQA